MKGKGKTGANLHAPSERANLTRTAKISIAGVQAYGGIGSSTGTGTGAGNARVRAFRRHGSFTTKTAFPPTVKEYPIKLDNYFTHAKPSHESHFFDTLGASSSKNDSFCQSNLRSSRQIPKSQTSVSSLVQELVATKPFALGQSSFKDGDSGEQLGRQAALELPALKSPDTLGFKKLAQKGSNLATEKRRNENMDLDGFIKDQCRKIESNQNLEKKFRQIDHKLACSQQNILRHRISLLKNLEIKFNTLNNSTDKACEKRVFEETSHNRPTDKSGKRASVTKKQAYSISQSRRMTFESTSFPHADALGSFGKKHSRIDEGSDVAKKAPNELEFANVFKILNFLGKDKALHQNRKKLQHKIKELNREALHNVGRQQPQLKDVHKEDEAFLTDYKLQQVLGRGSYGEVKLALHLKSSALYAIKIYPKKFLADEVKRENIENEQSLLSQLSHPNIIGLKEVLAGPRFLYLVTEYGGPFSLHEYLTKGTKSVFSEKEARPLIKQLCGAVNYLHERNIVHRDVKLHNILLNDSHLKLIDFGFACQVRDHELLKVFCGTPSYMSPEILGKKPYEGKPCDVWALGVCVYRMVVGAFPFRGGSEEELFAKIKTGKFALPTHLSAEFCELVCGMLQTEPARRLTTPEILDSAFFVS